MTAGTFDSYEVMDLNDIAPTYDGWADDSAKMNGQRATVTKPRRLFSRWSAGSKFLRRRYVLLPTVGGGRYASPGGGQSAWIDCTVQLASSTSFNSNTLHLGMKFRRTKNGAFSETNDCGGYHISWYQPSGGGTPEVRFHKREGEEDGDAAGAQSATFGTFVNNGKYRIRLTVTDNAGDDDILIEEDTSVGLDGSGWTTRHTETILSTDTHYIPWGDANYGGFGFQIYDSNTNFGNYGQSQCYLEDLRARVG